MAFNLLANCYRNPYAKLGADKMVLTSLNKLSELYLIDGQTYGHTPIVERVCFVKYSAKCLKKNSVINNEYSCRNFLGNFFVLLGQSIRPSIISYSLLGAQLLCSVFVRSSVIQIV